MSDKYKVLVSRKLPIQGLQLLMEKCVVEINPFDRAFTREELGKYLTDKDALLCVGDKIDADLLDLNSSLKIISNYGVGYDNIDLRSASQRGIIVTNLPGVVTESTAEHTLALLLAVSRRVVEADAFLRVNECFESNPLNFMGSHLFGKSLGIVGLGRIGHAVARRAISFGMKVAYYSRSRKYESESEMNLEYLDFHKLLALSDVISIHLPLSAETYHLFGEEEFAAMKPSVIIINMARGPVIDEQALIVALKMGKIGGAGLDVFEKEPQVPEGLRNLKNVVLTPHIGSATLETRIAMALMASQKIIDLNEGRVPQNIVNDFIL